MSVADRSAWRRVKMVAWCARSNRRTPVEFGQIFEKARSAGMKNWSDMNE
jgi:hypothetical protein